jgi:hypothetical protein
MASSTPTCPQATFGTTKKKLPGMISRAQAMYTAVLAAAAIFSSPPLTMVAFMALIQAVLDARQAALAGTKGLAAVRNTKRDALWTAMMSLRNYIQSIVDTQTPEAGIATIQTAGLLVAKTKVFLKPILAAKLTATPGLVHLVANRLALCGRTAKLVTLSWQWSLDGKTWSSAPSTPHAKTDVTGLSLMTIYWFRVSATVGTETGEWSQPVCLLVH